MTKKQAVSRRLKRKLNRKAAVLAKQAESKGSPLRPKSGSPTKNLSESSAKKPAAAGTLNRKAKRLHEGKERGVLPAVPGDPHGPVAVPEETYDMFMNVLTELADAKLSNTDPEIWFMGLYYGPPSNPNDVFMLWVTQKSSAGRFHASPILGFIKTPSRTVNLDANRSVIQNVLDVQTLLGVLEQGNSGNHPDADVINLLIEAIQAERYHIMLPKNPSSPVLTVAKTLGPLTEELAGGARESSRAIELGSLGLG
jgi:hypothetical protein